MSFYSSYFSFFSQEVLFTAVSTSLYLYFIAFFVPSKVLIEVSARFGFLHKNRFFVSQTFPSPLFPSRPGINLKWSENVWAWFLYVYGTLIILSIFDLSHGSASKNSSLRTVLFWQIRPFLLHSLFYCFLCGFLCSTSFQ